MSDGPLTPLAHGRAALVELLDRRAALSAALELLARDGDVVWMANAVDEGTHLVLDQIRGDRTGLLRGLRVPDGLGLTGKVHGSGRPWWVDDYFRADDITHTFDGHIEAEAVRRLLAVPVRRHGRAFGVLAVGARFDGVFGDRAVTRARAIADEAALAAVVAERARLAREVAVHEHRSRIAAELHDSVGALLFAIGSGVAGLAESAAGDPELTARLERLRRQAGAASAALRDSLRTLRASPAALQLSVSLNADCAAFADRTGIPAELVVLDHDPPELSPSRTEVLVAAVREALLNVEKHARASAVVVTAGRSDRPGIFVAVTDDGVGLPAGHVPGLGLTATADAAGRLGGTVRVASNLDGGTTWRIELPVLSERIIRVVVVDDHPVVRDGVVTQLARFPGISVVGHAADAAAAVRLCGAERPDVVLLDVRLPDGLAVDVVPRLLAVSTATRVLLFTAFPEHAAVGPSLAAGAAGLLVKDATGTALHEAVREVARTGRYRAPMTGPGAVPITSREYDVLRLVACGHTNAEIGDQLGLSLNTVKAYLHNVMHKLAARNRAQVITQARAHGLL